MSGFDKVIGYKSIKTELERIADIIKNPEKYDKFGVTFPRGIVLIGDPGVGKTLICNAFMEECGINNYTCRKTESGGEFVKTIKNTFDEAVKNQPSIILLDDMDKFANGDEDHKDCEEYVTVQACIDNVKGQKVFVLATVNDIDKVPRSLVRAGRFDKRIDVENPTGQDAVDIVNYYLSQKKNLKDIDPVRVARMLNGNSCAELELVINDAGVYAGSQGKEYIDMSDITKACLRVLYDAPETIQEDAGEAEEKVAWHEIGHAVISELLEPNSVTLIAVEGYEGNNQGFTSFYMNDNYWKSYRLMENRVMSLLGGRAATELKLGEIDVGCSRDLQRATDILNRMVGEYASMGFDKIVRVHWRDSENHLSKVENTVGEELTRRYTKVKQMLVENMEFVNKLGAELIEKRLLTCDDVQRIKSTCNIKL